MDSVKFWVYSLCWCLQIEVIMRMYLDANVYFTAKASNMGYPTFTLYITLEYRTHFEVVDVAIR